MMRHRHFKPAPAAVLLSFCVVGIAAAAEGGGSQNPIESGTFANAIATVITFGVVVLILGKMVWPHVLKALKDRENFIRESLESAKRDREEAEQRLKEYQTQIANARQEATAIVEEGRRDSEVLRRKMQDDAKKEADAIMVRAKREIGIARDTAVMDLYSVSGRLAADLAGKILQKELDASAHDRLIQESIDHISKLESRN